MEAENLLSDQKCSRCPDPAEHTRQGQPLCQAHWIEEMNNDPELEQISLPSLRQPKKSLDVLTSLKLEREKAIQEMRSCQETVQALDHVIELFSGRIR